MNSQLAKDKPDRRAVDLAARPLQVMVYGDASAEHSWNRTLCSLRRGATFDTHNYLLCGIDCAAPADLDATCLNMQADLLTALLRLALDPASLDIVLVKAGIEVPAEWDVRLVAAGANTLRCGAASALVCGKGYLGLGMDVGPAGEHLNRLDSILYSLSEHTTLEIPYVGSALSWLSHEALRDLISLPEAEPSGGNALDVLSRMLHASGWATVATDFLLVSGEERQGDHSDRRLNYHLESLRRLVLVGEPFVGYSLARYGLDARPVVLHVLHSWGGGLAKWVNDFCSADTSRLHLMLASVGMDGGAAQRLLLKPHDAPDLILRAWDFDRPADRIQSRSMDYERAIHEVMGRFSVDAIIVSSLVGHSLEVLEQNVPTVVVLHDYLPICKAVFPSFGGVCSQCNSTDLKRCEEQNELNAEFSGMRASEWEAMRTRFVDIINRRKLPLIAPTPGLPKILTGIAPKLIQTTVHVIPHGISSSGQKLPIQIYHPQEQLRLVVLGSLNPRKGIGLLRQIGPRLQDDVNVTLLGCGKAGLALAAEFGWSSIEQYQVAELKDILVEIAPHAGILASIFPETYSYTLSELQDLGIPPLATRLGSFADRIEEGVSGLLFDPNPSALLELLQEIRRNPVRLNRVAEMLQHSGLQRGMVEMLRDYGRFLPDSSAKGLTLSDGVTSALTGHYLALLGEYRELEAAFRSTHDAYKQVNEAYLQSRSALDTAENQLQQLGAKYSALSSRTWSFLGSLGQLELDRKWWRGRQVSAALEQFRQSLGATETDSPLDHPVDGRPEANGGT